ncbi:MAG TPA: SDR family NAD(P)-dependent oxidoreductase [Chloroflexota bacterium]|nr:SDR family NAD(P)-dependent oxidoreductase [Chloroflexota bacterium]
MRDFAGKVAVVTGAASGIGFGLATRLAEEGMKVVLADVEEPALQAAVASLHERGFADVIGVPTDVSDAVAVEALAQATLDAFDKVHVVCNNAGVGGGFGKIWEASLKDWQWALNVNLWGVIHGVHTFVPLLLEHGEPGHVVNTASVAGLVPGARVYSVTKHAVVALSEALYHNLRQISAPIGASVLCPGLIDTRIMFGYRNRPVDLRNAADETASRRELERAERIANMSQELGMPPAVVAQKVVDAIRDEQFYVLTHDHFDATIRDRMEDILQRRVPTPYQSELGD